VHLQRTTILQADFQISGLKLHLQLPKPRPSISSSQVGPFVSERKLILSGIGGACVGLPPAARPAEAGAEPRAGVALAGVLEVAAPRRARRDSHRPKKGTAAQGDRHALPVLVQMVAVATGDRCCDDGRRKSISEAPRNSGRRFEGALKIFF
jgi:hypothetical protein